MEAKEKIGVSFGFSKKSETKRLKLTEDGANIDDKDNRDFVRVLENQEVKSVKPKEEKKEIIIPLIKTNNWKTAITSEKENQLDSIAVQEIIQDAAKQNEDWDSSGKVDPNLQIPLLIQNKIPDGFETDDKLDVSLRPDEPEEANYDEIPIEAYGMAMLKGMGWKQGQGIGKNNKAAPPVEAVLRPKGMGLGADRKQAQNLNDSKKGGNSKKTDEEDGELRLKKGSCCLMEHGTHKDLYGKIEGLDEDNARVMVKLTVSGKLVNVSQYNIKLVTSREYNKYSKYINKGAADRYKNKEQKEKDRQKKDRDEEEERRHRTEEDRLSDHGDKYGDRRKDRNRDENREKPKKRKHERSEERHQSSSYSISNGISQSSESRLWVRPKIRVRIIDKNYKKGKHYNTKVIVIDVCDRDHCVCKTEEGRVLEDISQSMIETVVPKSDSAYVAIVSGKYRGQVAHVLKRDKSKCEALLQLLSDRDTVLRLDYDSICEYVGDVDEEFDY